MALSYNQLLSKLSPYCKRRNIEFIPYSGGRTFIIKFSDGLKFTITHSSPFPQSDKFTIYLSKDNLSADGKYFFSQKYYTIREVTQIIKEIDENYDSNDYPFSIKNIKLPFIKNDDK